MSLADKITKLDFTLKENSCAYMTMYNALSTLDKKALDNAWAKGYSANVILSALRSEGIKSSNEAIRRHRIGACKCPQTKK